MSPEFSKMADKYSNLVFCKCDVDKVQNLADHAGIQAMPT